MRSDLKRLDEARIAELGAAVERARNPPVVAAAPVRAPRTGMRRFDAAIVDRLTASWQAYNVAIDLDLRTSLDRLRARSRDLFKNNEYAAKFGHMVRNNVVGPNGFALQMQVKDPGGSMDDAANKSIEDAFDLWSRPTQCDVAGKRGFGDICRAAVLALARDGEFLIRKLRGPGAGLFGYQLQMLDVDRLDTLYNVAPAEGRNAVIMGVEVDQYRRPVAYHLWDRHPLEDAHATTRYRERVPAAEILHGFIPIEDEQTRGIPWAHAVMRRVNDLNGYREAAVIAARVGASKMGFFTSPDGQPGGATDGKDDSGNFISDASPGTFETLPEGYDFKTYNPDYPHQQFEMFCNAALQGIASGLSVSYAALANDPGAANFASLRIFTLEEREHWMGIQQWMIGALLQPVHADWLQAALAAQQISLPNGSPLPLAKFAKFAAHAWLPRRWQWVDPLKDMAARVLAIENGLDSPQNVAAQGGRDIEDVIEDLRVFQKLVKDKDVLLTGTKAPTGAIASAVAMSGSDAGTQDDVSTSKSGGAQNSAAGGGK